MNRKQELLFVLGAPKTGTSTLVAMLNAFPDVFLLYEGFLLQTVQKRSGKEIRKKQFLRRYPELAPIFQVGDLGAYHALGDRFPDYAFVGDKMPGYLPVEPYCAHKVVLTVRDIRTWLSKNKVVNRYYVDNSVVATAVNYVSYLIRSIQCCDRILVVKMEDSICRNQEVMERLIAFLGLQRPPTEEWWTGVGRYHEDEPKSHWRWWDGHPSSLVEPQQLDTVVKLKPHPFWNQLLPIFEKYYAGTYDLGCASADLARVAKLKSFEGITLTDLYEQVDNIQVVSQ